MAGEYNILHTDGSPWVTVHPLEFNGSKTSVPREIIAANSPVNSFRVVGDLTYRFTPGFSFDVIQSAGNNGTYTTLSSSFDGMVPGRTTISVAFVPSNALPFGAIQYTIPSAEIASSLTLAGRGTLNWGEVIQTDILQMLEHFADSSAPPEPTVGQLWFDTGGNVLNVYDNTNNWILVGSGGGGGSPGNPTAQVGLTAINGVATTYMRSDAAPALNQSITPTWTGSHTFTANTIAANIDADSISLENGSAGTPSLTLQNSPSTGLYRGGTNALGISTNGTSRLVIDSSGAWLLAGTTAGTSGQVFTSNGTGTPPTWQAPPSGPTLVRETQLGTDASSNIFTLATVTYTPLTNALFVYRNGQKLVVGTDYTEPSSTTVDIDDDIVIDPDDVFEFYAAVPPPTAPIAPQYEEQVSSGVAVVSTTIPTLAKSSGRARLQVFVNGVFQQEGATKQFTVTGANQITFNIGAIPNTNDDIVIFAFS